MKKRLTIMVITITCLLGACKKDDNGTSGGDSGVAITDASGARALFSEMNILWSATLRPALSKSTQIYTNTTLAGSSGTAVVNGQYATTHASSSFSSSSSSTIDVTIVFKDFQAGDIHINGTVRFFDYSSTRSACSDAGCATSSHSDLDYESKDGAGKSLGAASVQFKYGSQSYKDAVIMDIGRSDDEHWSIKVTNSSNQTINTSY